MLTFNTSRNNQKNNEMFPTKHPSVLNFMQKTEGLSKEHIQKLQDTRRGEAVPDKLENANIPPLPCSYLSLKLVLIVLIVLVDLVESNFLLNK